jgi:ribosome-associated heat shock protein Hsp15
MRKPTEDRDESDADGEESGAAGNQRLDKWLWFARLVKSRTLAATLVGDGKIRVNRERITKPAHGIRPGDVITAAIHRSVRIVKVIAIGARRGPASEAQTLYEELGPDGRPVPPPAKRPPADMTDAATALPPERPRGMGRPTKRDRRQIESLHGRKR